MAHIILTGATGQAGAAILVYALHSPLISHISILSRRPVVLAENQSKATVIIHQDFERYSDSVLQQLNGAIGCIWAQGISSFGMNEADYTKITVDYPVAAAKNFSTLGEKLNFVYVSGEGANMVESKAGMMFGRVNGRAEKALLELQIAHPSLKVYNVRPAAINPEGQHLAERTPTLGDRASTVLLSVLTKVWKRSVISTNDLAKVCVDLAVGSGAPTSGSGIEADGRVLTNVALRRMAGL